MWEVSNETPYAAESTWTRDKHGNHHWLVAVKATYDILDRGILRLAEHQVPICEAPEFWGDPGVSSLRYDLELVMPKPTTDVVISGSAHAPGGRPASQVLVEMRVADICKALVVYGPRVYESRRLGKLVAGASDPYIARRIRYEDAYGGMDLTATDPRQHCYDARNPAGKGVASDTARLLRQPAHTIEYPSGDVTSRGPAGFGPIADFWSPRRERGGTYDSRWEKHKKPLLPDDHDTLSLQCAPDDQRPARALHGDEVICMTNLTPNGQLEFSIPKVYLAFTTFFGERSEEHRSRLGTVIVEPDIRRVQVVWNTALQVKRADLDYLDETTIVEKPYLT